MPFLIRTPHTTTRPPAQRSLSQDSAGLADKAKASKTRPKKGSQHADVIDRLDFTGVGPSMPPFPPNTHHNPYLFHSFSVPPRWPL
jgi:hypothetical protein